MKSAFDWLTIANTIGHIIDMVGKGGDAYEKLPEALKQKVPGFLGLSLEDERIFNAIMALLKSEQQIIIANFLNSCRDFQRNRFINIVAGMEVVQGAPKIVERKTDPNTGKVVSEKVVDEKPGIDLRKKFLENFADIVIREFKGDLDKARDFCLGGRMILENPFYQKALDVWTKSCEQYGKALKVFGARDTAEFFSNVVSKVGAETNTGLTDITARMRGLRQRIRR